MGRSADDSNGMSADRDEQARLTRMTEFERSAFDLGYEKVAGIDEAGRGPLAGPVVAAAVILPLGYRLSGLRDSKKLSPSQRDDLFEKINEAAVSVGIGIVHQDIIDKVNILEATLLAMRKAIELLRDRPELLLIDALSLPTISIPQWPIIRGDDKSLSIAAASVVAKVTRDRLMVEYDKMYPMYDFRTHKGYGTPKHLEALKVHGPCALHRRSFRRVVQNV